LNALRRAGRIGVAAAAAWFFIVVATQYVRVTQRNLDLAGDLQGRRSEIASLEAKRDQELRDIKRLSDPRGAIPEIHDRLKYVGPHEAIVYFKGATPAPSSAL
jgi:cell division protein FtsB